jgi:predicted nuclease with RNAse H fold
VTNSNGSTTTAGVDFASQASNTAACVIIWTSNSAAVTELTTSCDDDYILELVSRVTKLGIDVPLGWPSPFVEALRLHAHDGSWPAQYEHATNLKDYRLRSTDNWVHETLKLPLPLSVATDRIAIPTMRAAALFARINPRPALDGTGRVTEVYPAAALARWGFRSKGYKGKANLEQRRALVDAVAGATHGWLTFTADQQATCVENDNALDSLIASLVGRAAMKGLTESIPLALRAAALREGWISIPREGSLALLASDYISES